MVENYYRQGDILYFDFSPSYETEIRGIHPAIVMSSDMYNRNTGYLMVVPVTSRGTKFNSYIKLTNYGNIYGRANAAQLYSYSAKRAKSKVLDHLRVKDFNRIREKLQDNLAF